MSATVATWRPSRDKLRLVARCGTRGCCPSLLESGRGWSIAQGYGWTYDRTLRAWRFSSRAAQQWREHERAGGAWRTFSYEPIDRRTGGPYPPTFAGNLGGKRIDLNLPARVVCPICGRVNDVPLPDN